MAAAPMVEPHEKVLEPDPRPAEERRERWVPEREADNAPVVVLGNEHPSRALGPEEMPAHLVTLEHDLVLEALVDRQLAHQRTDLVEVAFFGVPYRHRQTLPSPVVDDDALLALLHETADEVRRALDALEDWSYGGVGHPGQYRSDVAADAAALAVLEKADVAVLSEETGLHRPDRPLLVVVDPVDGSTNASRQLPWYATSLCALDDDGPRAAVVVNQATGQRYEALRGGGARCDGEPIASSNCATLGTAVISVAGWPSRHLGWRQLRAFGAAALDLCAVASGRVDAYVDCTNDLHGPWDWLGGLLVCQEAGAPVRDLHGRDLRSRVWEERRTVLAAATPELLDEVLEARRSLEGQ